MLKRADVDADSEFATVDGLRIHYKRAGRGPVVLLLHGTTSSLEHFDRSAAILHGCFDVIRPDLPGFGRTGPRPDGAYRVRTYAATVAAFMEQLNVTCCAVAGNSLGGNITWNLALDHPGHGHWCWPTPPAIQKSRCRRVYGWRAIRCCAP